jgi:hypothetical protein
VDDRIRLHLPYGRTDGRRVQNVALERDERLSQPLAEMAPDEAARTRDQSSIGHERGSALRGSSVNATFEQGQTLYEDSILVGQPRDHGRIMPQRAKHP